jgi:hypothetical protein
VSLQSRVFRSACVVRSKVGSDPYLAVNALAALCPLLHRKRSDCPDHGLPRRTDLFKSLLSTHSKHSVGSAYGSLWNSAWSRMTLLYLRLSGSQMRTRRVHLPEHCAWTFVWRGRPPRSEATMLHFKPLIDVDAAELAHRAPLESAAGQRASSVQHFCYRARQERQAALRASDPQRRRAHLRAADLHRQLARSLSRHSKRRSPKGLISPSGVDYAVPTAAHFQNDRTEPRLRVLALVVVGAATLIAIFGGMSILVQFLRS